MSSLSHSITPVSVSDQLRRKIQDRSARPGVIGLGYVGLPLMVELAEAGFSAIGVDSDPRKISSLQAKESYVGDVDSSLLARLVDSKRLRASSDISCLAECDTVSICVPTPLRKTKDPDLSFVVAATETLATQLHPGMLVVLESTTYPGTTQEIILPALERSGLRVGEDFFLCFSPERVDPGNPTFHTRNIPKVIGGVTPQCTEMGALFYGQVMDRVVPVSSTRVAEMVKLLENTFRMINIGLANEMAMLCNGMDIDVWEVIEAAATKPFGFMPFYPGPGLGGHCIPVDPHYLSWKTKQAGQEARFIELATQINVAMPLFVADKVQAALNDHSKPVKGSRIHVMGVAYKRDISDVRESPALDILALLGKRGAVLSYSDPLVPQLTVDGLELHSAPVEESAKTADCVVIVTDHSAVDYSRLLECSQLIVDTRNRLKGFNSPKITRL
jgi:UDP-N-acetyl-D-glucosamine dehydrogenase